MQLLENQSMQPRHDATWSLPSSSRGPCASTAPSSDASASAANLPTHGVYHASPVRGRAVQSRREREREREREPRWLERRASNARKIGCYSPAVTIPDVLAELERERARGAQLEGVVHVLWRELLTIERARREAAGESFLEMSSCSIVSRRGAGGGGGGEEEEEEINLINLKS